METKISENAASPGRTLAKIIAGLVGIAGFGATVVALPFISPAFRRHCLPYVPATNEQIENVLMAVKTARNRAPKNIKQRWIDLGSGDGRVGRYEARYLFSSVFSPRNDEVRQRLSQLISEFTMKFGEQLSTQLTPEWRKKYIDYEALKNILYSRLEKAPSAEIDNTDRRERYFARQDEEFFKRCADELEKINLFFNQKLAESQSKYRDLLSELELARKAAAIRKRIKEETIGTAEGTDLLSPLKWIRRRGAEGGALLPSRSSAGLGTDRDLPVILEADERDDNLPTKTEREIKAALKEFYLELILLQNYQQMNITGFRKILKKHDKTWENCRGSEWKKANVATAPFAVNKEVDKLIEQVENVYSEHLESGNRQKAMKSLRVPPLSEKQSAWTTFSCGFFLGTFAVIFCTIVLSIIYLPGIWEPPWVVVRLYRGFLLIFINIFLMGLNMYVWQSSGVNHVLIFEIDPRNHLTYQNLLALGAVFCSLWGICLVGFFYAPVIHVPRLCFPLLLMSVCLLWLFNPFNCFLRSSRYWLLRRLFCCFSSPFHSVTFPDFWLADQMNSLVTFFLDMEYFACFYIAEVDYSNGTMAAMIKHDNWTSIYAFGGNGSRHDPYWAVDGQTGSDVCSTNAYGIRPLISLLPALIRFLQCIRRYRDSRQSFPHLVNAGKYSTTFFVVIFGSLNTWDKQRRGLKEQHLDSPYFYIWVLAYVVSFCYTYFWDVKMDWGLFAKKPGEHRWLREELIYKHIWFYYAAVAADAVMRLGWVLNVSLGDAWLAAAQADLLMCVTAVIECGRRCMWNFFRLENEHLNNVGQFRAVRDISIIPLHKGDFDELLEQIDDEDGVTHRSTQYQMMLQRKLKAVKSKNPGSLFRDKFLRKRRSLAALQSSSAIIAGGQGGSGDEKANWVGQSSNEGEESPVAATIASGSDNGAKYVVISTNRSVGFDVKSV